MVLYCRGVEALQEPTSATSAEGGGGGAASAAEKGVSESTAATHIAVLRHVGRTTGSEAVDLLYRWARATYLPGAEGDDDGGGDGGGSTALPPLSAAERAKVRSVGWQRPYFRLCEIVLGVG